MTYELMRCPSCNLFISLRGYDYHVMRCGDTIDKVKADYLAGDIGKIGFHRRASALGFTTEAIRQILFEVGTPAITAGQGAEK